MLRLLSSTIFFYCLIFHTYAQTFICNKLADFDTEILHKPAQWSVTTDYQCLGDPAARCTYYFAFCDLAESCFGQYSACQNATGATNVTIIGSHVTTQFYADDPKLNGFYAKFAASPMQNISNTTRCEPQFRINFICNKDAHWYTPLDPKATATAPYPVDINIDPEDPCYTIMDMEYAGACKANSAPTNRPIHIGAVVMIVFFSALVVYFIGGAIYNRLVKHQSGINLIPHAQFWIGLPLHAITGCRVVLNCCSGKSPESRATYESV